MIDYDLCVAWNWVYDSDFITLLDAGCQARGLTMLQVTPSNLAETLHSLADQEIACQAFFDRASDEDSQFMPLVQWIHENRIFGINAYERASLTWDKAEMHSMLISIGVEVPPTIILPAYFDQSELACIDIFSDGDQYALKPAHGSGGVGVVTNVSSWEQVLTVRQEHGADKYLLQAQVDPVMLADRPAWFRVIYCTGQIYSFWWNPADHIYTPVTPQEKLAYGLDKLEETVAAISRLCGLDLFSTEIAHGNDEQYRVVDYINDQIDLRLQSNYIDGVPDEFVHEIARRLVSQLVQVF